MYTFIISKDREEGKTTFYVMGRQVFNLKGKFKENGVKNKKKILIQDVIVTTFHFHPNALYKHCSTFLNCVLTN